ncbi:ribonuclease H-like protein [Myriangium duriaei CBS 260.36]|uniref:ribonuclease H n=1 Tax=Myriangium duriaei CBS 260.36 TaxID=1168546 RepID=A0A9P4JAN9_9PEZI|nr:ribonuclease H-like protein [Myriangium duriaei CBS 260.36]
MPESGQRFQGGYKSFTTLADAENFLHTGLSARVSSKGPAKFYGVRSGKVPGVYATWEEASAQINGWTKPRYKSFPTKAEAEAFVKGSDSPTANGETGTPDKDADKGTSKKKKKVRESAVTSQDENGGYAPGEGPLPAGAEDGFDPSIALNPLTGKVEHKNDAQLQATLPQARDGVDDGMIRIWTDGSSRGNGTKGAVAGVGVYFGPGDKRYVGTNYTDQPAVLTNQSNLAEALAGPRQTNQRAELTAILRALELSPRDRPVTILSDSSYAINCVTTWYQRWRANGWVNSQKKPVENKDLIEKILSYIEERERISNIYSTSPVDDNDETKDNAKMRSFKKGRARVHFVWVKGHADEPGNVAADALAVAGARKVEAD